MSGIVVGVDGSGSAAEALRWAMREGELHGWPVTAVLAWSYLYQHHVEPDGEFRPEYGEDDARVALDAYVERALEPEAAATVARAVPCALAAEGMLDAAQDATLLVLGARGLGGFKGLLLGSVSQHCLHHASGPVAVVRGLQPRSGETTMERIVVGVDGSETADRALDWAMEEARLRAATLEVVLAWHLPYVAGYPYAGVGFDANSFERDSREALDKIVDRLDTAGIPEVVRTLKPGDAASVLLEAGTEADLIVVGSRGLGGFTGLLLGSVSHHVTHHATCPVVVVPPER